MFADKQSYPTTLISPHTYKEETTWCNQYDSSSTSSDMMLFVVVSVLLQLVSGKSAPKLEKSCLAKGDGFYSLVSTMTPYDDVRGSIEKVKGCKAEALWSFIRHGTRFPKVHLIYKFANKTILRDEIVQNHEEGRGLLCQHDVELFRKWHPITDVNQNMLLTMSGIEELRKFGLRIQKNFEELVKDYESGDVEVGITFKERTRQSAEAFLTGLYDCHHRVDNDLNKDHLLKNEQKCPAWKKSVKSPKLKQVTEEFKNSKEMQAVIERLGKTLGFERKLEFDEVKDMYDMCSFEYAWYHTGKYAPWCSAFTDEDLKIMEYFEDIVYYYKSAFGNPLTPKLGCTHVKDIIDKLSAGTPKATFYFGHSSGNRKLLTTLGIGNGPSILSGEGYSDAADRNWKTSLLTPFAANVVVVKYKCKKGSHGLKDPKRVAVYVNEKLTPIPACGGKDMCSFEDFKKAFAPITNPNFCNRDFCGTEEARSYAQEDDDDYDDDD